MPRRSLLERAAAVEAAAASGQDLPLYGVPFAVKDNIDVAGVPTTAGCPSFAYTPTGTARVVADLEEAGAILVGKTNLDQFATGLVGVRTPYGVPVNPFDPDYIPGGSSSGSAVAVSAGLVSFALGTDTAGSGRIPASFNNIVGLKPTRGLLSTRGVVPACRSLDCISIFALSAADAGAILTVAAQYDAGDSFARRWQSPGAHAVPLQEARLGVPRTGQLDFFGDDEAAELFKRAVDLCRAQGAEIVEFDYGPFGEAAALLYGGAWVAERDAAVGDFLKAHRADADPVVAGIILDGADLSARDAFEASYRLAELRRQAEPALDDADALLLPTAGTIYTVAELDADPVTLNSNLGTYTNFMNLFDLSGIAVPAGFRSSGLPFGITLAAPAFHDRILCGLGAGIQQAISLPMGATGVPLYSLPGPLSHPVSPDSEETLIAVVGAHLRGEPLNGALVGFGARFVGAIRTAPDYRLYLLPDVHPARPGLIRTSENGGSIDVELWSLPRERVGDLLATVAPPLGLGTVDLEDGRSVTGFICEGQAAEAALEITEFGGWRAYLAATQSHAADA